MSRYPAEKRTFRSRLATLPTRRTRSRRKIGDNGPMRSAGDDPIPAPEPSGDEGRSLAAGPHDELPDEPRRERLLRHVRRVRLYSSATGIVVLLVVLVLLTS